MKVRRLQRGIATLDGLLRKAKAGKEIPEDEIPPMVATGQAQAPVAQPTAAELTDSPIIKKKPPIAPPKPLVPVAQGGENAVAAPLVQIEQSPPEATSAVDDATINLLESRQREYRDAALAAKRSGNKENALKYFRVLKVLFHNRYKSKYTIIMFLSEQIHDINVIVFFLAI